MHMENWPSIKQSCLIKPPTADRKTQYFKIPRLSFLGPAIRTRIGYSSASQVNGAQPCSRIPTWKVMGTSAVWRRRPQDGRSAERSRKMHVASIDLLLMFVLFSAHCPVNLTASPSLPGTAQFLTSFLLLSSCPALNFNGLTRFIIKRLPQWWLCTCCAHFWLPPRIPLSLSFSLSLTFPHPPLSLFLSLSHFPSWVTAGCKRTMCPIPRKIKLLFSLSLSLSGRG